MGCYRGAKQLPARFSKAKAPGRAMRPGVFAAQDPWGFLNPKGLYMLIQKHWFAMNVPDFGTVFFNIVEGTHIYRFDPQNRGFGCHIGVTSLP